ncbi:MAG: AMP-binding protein [Pontiella sp.]
MEQFCTIPEMLIRHASQHVNARVVNDRVGNTWLPVSMVQLQQRVSTLAFALDARIPVHGSSIGVLASPCTNWLVADMAIMLAGGVSIPFFVDFSAKHFQFKVDDSGMKSIFVFGETLWERFLPFADQFDLVITDQSAGERMNVVHVEELYDEGEELLEEDLALTNQLLDRIGPDDLAVIIYTSGSTGMPKGVELTHQNLVAQLHDIRELFPVDPGNDRALSLLPVAHTFERIVIYLYLIMGMSIYFVDDVDKVGELMRDVGPAMMTVVPRLLEKTHGRIREKAAGIPGLKGRFARWTFRRANRSYLEDQGFSAANWIADQLVGWQVMNAFGGKLNTVIAGGAHMPDELNHFFVRMGIPIYEGYGMTEASPVISVNYPGHRKIGTVGRALASVELRISKEGEVWARGPSIMRAYRHMPEETARVIDSDGWLHTGDLGRMDDEGYLTIVARQKELFKTSTGETVFPGPLEQALCRSVLVEVACIIAEARKFTSCLLFLSAIATEMGPAALKQKIEEHIRQVNSDLDHWEKIHGYALLKETPSTENGELTPTMKIRRHAIEEHYTELIEKLYDENQLLEEFREIAIGHC